MTLDLSVVKRIAEQTGLFVGDNISGIALVVQKDEYGYHNHITLEELMEVAQSCYAMGAAEERERIASLDYLHLTDGQKAAIRSQE